jgi:hypothetical protein
MSRAPETTTNRQDSALEDPSTPATSAPGARPLLTALADENLLTEPAPGRYGFHDLIAAYAQELSRGHDGDDVRRLALHRLLDHYLHTAYRAAMLLAPDRPPLRLTPPRPGVTPVPLTDAAGALAWFQAEHPVLVGVILLAAREGFDDHVWQLVWTWADFLTRRERATAEPDRGADDPRTHFRHALYQWEHLTEPSGRARLHLSLALAWEQPNVYKLRNLSTGKCLDIEGPWTTDGTTVHQWGCEEYAQYDSQQWAQIVANGGYMFYNAFSQTCLDVREWATGDDASLQIWTCGDTSKANQIFF